MKNMTFLTDTSDSEDCSTNTSSQVTLLVTDKSERKKKCYFNYNPFLGIFYTLVSSTCFTLASVFVKQLHYINTSELTLIRNLILWLVVLPIAICKAKEILGPTNDRILLIAAGLLGGTSLLLNVTAFTILPLAEATIIMATLPAISTLIAHIFLKELCGFIEIITLIITFCGMLASSGLPELLSKRNDIQFNTIYFVGLACAVGSVLMLSLTSVAIRRMKYIHFSVPILYCGFIGMVENGVLNILLSDFIVPHNKKDVLIILLMAICGSLGTLAWVLALHVESVSLVSIMRTSLDIIIAVNFQIIFFNSKPDIFGICGAFLVILSVSIIGMKKWLSHETETDNV